MTDMPGGHIKIAFPSTRLDPARQIGEADRVRPEEFAKMIASDIIKWAKVVKAAGLKVE